MVRGTRRLRATLERAGRRTAPAPPPAPEPAPPVAKGPLKDLGQFLPGTEGRTVVVLAHPSQREVVGRWLAQFPHDNVHVLAREEAAEWSFDGPSVRFHTAASLDEVSKRVRFLGAVDVVVNLLPADRLPEGAEDQLMVFARLFRYLRRRGCYILDRSTTSASSSTLGLAPLLEILAAADAPNTARKLHPVGAELARSTGAVTFSRDLLLVTKRFDHLVKVGDAEANRALTEREPDLTVSELASLPGGRLTSRARVSSHPPSFEAEHLPELIEYPELHLRHYTGQVAFSGATLMWAGHTLLPDSFRWHLTDVPDNPRLKHTSRGFARVGPDQVPKRTLAGSYYQLDAAYSRHFGHITTEVLSRLWGWDEAKRRIPDLKAIFRCHPNDVLSPKLQLGFFQAYGIAESDITWVTEPVWLESVVGASPMWHNAEPFYVHPRMAEVWERLRTGLMAGRPAGEHAKIFVSRGGGAKHRPCRNATEVEDLFRAHGFQIVYPEELSLADQAATFAGARVIAGFGGSAMFNMMYAQDLETVILLNHESYTARNEHLYTSVLGADVHYFWSPADLDHPEGDWTDEAFKSAWEFDFARNREALEDVLAKLG